MSQLKVLEIPPQHVTRSKLLGQGQFGEVYRGELRYSESVVKAVAVKVVKQGSPPEEKTKLLQEATTQSQFRHRHVVRLIGVVTLEEPVSVCQSVMQ